MGILENKLVNRPVWGRSHDQLKNIIWKKVSQGRKPLIPPKKKGKFGVEKRRSLGEAVEKSEAYYKAMINFKSGFYGTPEDPQRGAAHRAAFWDAYHGVPSMKHVSGSVADAHAQAGRDAGKRKEHPINKLKEERNNSAIWYWMKQQKVTNVKAKAALEAAKKKLKEGKDLIGKKTASVADIAKKHNMSTDQVEAQIAKGIRVEREHTSNDAEAHEIARDHLHEFPDYYDRLNKMEKKAKKDMKENTSWTTHWLYDNGKVLMGVRGHREASEKSIKQKAMRMNIKTPLHHSGMNPGDVHNAIRRSTIKIHEDAPANAVGGGMSPVIGGEGNIHGTDPIMGMARRKKKFAGKQVFVVDPTTYHKAYLGKRKYEHYEKYLEGCDIAEEIRMFGRTNWAEPIILQNEQTGAMIYLKYGSK